MKAAVRIYDRIGHALRHVDWHLMLFAAEIAAVLCFVAFTFLVDGCTLEPVSAQYSGDEM